MLHVLRLTGLLLAVSETTSAGFAARLDEVWKTRDAPDAIKQTEQLIAEGLQAFPDDYEVLWRAARSRWWVADGTTDSKVKEQLAKESRSFAERAVKARPTGAEGRYYAALSIGAYSQAVGTLKALSQGLEGQFNENLELAMKGDDAFNRHGAHTAKGRYWWDLPWPKRNLSKSKAELGLSIAKSPENLRNYYFLADTLLRDGDAKGAKVQIDKVLTGASEYDPAEARRVKAWARPLAEQIAKEL